MKKWERLAALFFAAMGIGAAIMAYRMGLGSLAMPGSGFFPFWISLLLVGVSFVYFLGQLSCDNQIIPFWEGRSWVKPLLAVGIISFYVFLIYWVGFFIATFFLFIIWLTMEREKPLTTILVAIIGTLCVYLLFGRFLQIPLPIGRLFH